MMHYLNPNLTIEECSKIDQMKMDGFKSTLEAAKKNAESLPVELRSQYWAVVMPLIAMQLR